MQSKHFFIVVTLISFICVSCIKRVDVPLRTEKPILVLEGSISTDTVAYTVKLSYSGKVEHADSILDANLEKDAKVTISDDQGKTTALTYTRQGIYTTTDSTYIGQVGRSYTVKVVLKDGRTFSSIPEKMAAPVKIDSITVRYNGYFDMYTPSRMDVFINIRDPAQEENYYRWTFNGWIGRETHGISCNFGCIMLQYCYQQYINTDVMILSDAAINGNEIKNQKVGPAYIYTNFNPYLDIGQISLTKSAYQFWERYQEQLTRTGRTLDPLPAAIRGNVFSTTNTNDYALGYFSAAPITHRKVILIPYSITSYWLQLSASEFIPPGSIACYDAFPNTLRYDPPPARQYPPPAGFENAEQIKVYW